MRILSPSGERFLTKYFPEADEASRAQITQELLKIESDAQTFSIREENDWLQLIDQRDRAEDMADQLAYIIAPLDAIGEHSSYNNPWLNAIEYADTQSALDTVHFERQKTFSLATFGPGLRTKGILDHIKKEMVEIESDPTDIKEWVDIILLAFDGPLRIGYEPYEIVEAVKTKLAVNEKRSWPDWRLVDQDQAIEHDRSKDENV